MIHWRDVIVFSEHPTDGEDHRVGRAQLEAFFDKLEKTPEGQDLLGRIQKKYSDPNLQGHFAGLPKLEISMNNNFRSVTFPSGQITIDTRDPEWSAFIDQRTGKIMHNTLEKIALHELFHAGDPRIKIGADNQNPYLSTVVEEGATRFADDWGKKYMPEWGVHGAYENWAGKKPEKIFDEPGRDGAEMLAGDAALREKIADLVRTRDARVAEAEKNLALGLGNENPSRLRMQNGPIASQGNDFKDNSISLTDRPGAGNATTENSGPVSGPVNNNVSSMVRP
jgi:hypothetical protein